jgi:hypothetical protein
VLGTELYSDLTDEERDAILDSVARKVVDRRLEMPAVLFLEMYKPLAFLASQALVVSMPMLSPLLGVERMSQLSRLLKDRQNIELLIQRIEQMAARVGQDCAAPEG